MTYSARQMRRGDRHTLQSGSCPPRERAPRTSVLLVDDHAVSRSGLRALLAEVRDVVVIGEAQDGRQAVAMAERLCPDVVVMDIAMPRLNGFEATRQVVAAVPTTQVVVLSAHDDDEYVARVTELGAAGYVVKSASIAELVEAIRTVRTGRRYVSPSIPWHERSRVRWTPGIPSAPTTPAPSQLTAREAEVLQLIAESESNGEIARELGISEKTVQKHRQSVMTKLDIHDVAGLTKYAAESGVIECCGAGSSHASWLGAPPLRRGA